MIRVHASTVLALVMEQVRMPARQRTVLVLVDEPMSMTVDSVASCPSVAGLEVHPSCPKVAGRLITSVPYLEAILKLACVVAAKEVMRLALHVSLDRVRPASKRGALSASALAKSTRIRHRAAFRFGLALRGHDVEASWPHSMRSAVA